METSCLKKKLTVLVTCIGGHFIGDICTALRDSPDMNLTIIGVDNNEASQGVYCAIIFSQLLQLRLIPKILWMI